MVDAVKTLEEVNRTLENISPLAAGLIRLGEMAVAAIRSHGAVGEFQPEIDKFDAKKAEMRGDDAAWRARNDLSPVP